MGISAAVATVGAAASTAVSAYGAYQQGKGTAAADAYQQAELQRKAQYAGIAATETNATLTDRLATSLGNIDVVRAAAHTDPSSPTTLALRARDTEVSNQEKAIKVGNILAQQSEDLYSADYLGQAGQFAMQMGEVSAGADVLKAVGQMAQLGSPAPSTAPITTTGADFGVPAISPYAQYPEV